MNGVQHLESDVQSMRLQSLQSLLARIQDRLDHLERKCDESQGGFLDTWFEERLAQTNRKAHDKIQDRLDHLERKCDVSQGGFLDIWFEERLGQTNRKAHDTSDTVMHSDEHAKENSENPFPHQTPIEVDETQHEASERSGFRAITDLDYKLGESVWDASILLWLPEIGFSSSCFLAGMLALNMFIQGFMSYVLLTTEEFVNSRKLSGVFSDMEKWRLIDGHDRRYMGLQEVSLVSRVCNMDESLSVASGQLKVIGEINSYLSLGVDDFDVAGGFSKGPLLSMICILVLALVVMREFRQNVYFLLCICTLPHSRTQLKEGIIEALSWPRLICIVILICARVTVSAAILISELCWLATTSDISSLILNAAALGFVLDIDEILFSSIVPTKVARTLNNVQPLRFSAKLYLMDATLPVLCTVLALIVAHKEYIAPNSARLFDIKRVLCAGGQRFVVAYNAETGMSTSREMQPFVGKVAAEDHPATMAVREITNSPPYDHRCWKERDDVHCDGPELYCFANTDHGIPIKSLWVGRNSRNFEIASKYSLAEFSKIFNPRCEDIQDDPEGSVSNCNYLHFFDTLRQEFFEHGSPSAHFRCSDYQQFCGLNEISFMLKSICPITCGCDNLLSGLFKGALGGTQDGCPATCAQAREDKLKSVPCSDISTESKSVTIAGWQRYWGDVFEYAFDVWPEHLWGAIENQSEVPVGCAAASKLLRELDTEPCFENEVMTRDGISKIVGFCPASCCRYTSTCIPQCLVTESASVVGGGGPGLS